ncbi:MULTISPECIES: exosome complex exonuclease Rrp41 [Archaeoglobus]|jgi:exosome complex component RRP41|uniref:Exosome complex component Rrp41 n=2 Tax=Archaeoglobus fulgidus TaxID=2234 RepID=RRP41_ARCFU|nr:MULTISPECIES: exosome complex exonuclease Rrp41 [Archaeoglobus]O29757.1 RecName: Full=Exosome complex component Rrp41 [Archaeoglobus fulgidus DSM 4304]2BA0_D Chain D, Archaeal exosome RNA binding protein RRP41 [Archaeoglobus fulgidus]2BA0_E Chain E, Archaeal exosome RNA binding protein RRP41 [Archaeoglobus fulgidus]2BA0_F Chain F, Archaeal exosome RNA binding protein RRP41 [Archaeoglobus fulgidus]2BA1_D Chain D, Archaeal exosome complex exonuclease RRP41 [Archaeoglobus fulgidus]2BA1_E Chai
MSEFNEKPEKLIVDGLRLDGRKFDELRPIKIEASVLKRADGSCYLEMGKNKVIAAVFGPREVHPRHLQDPSKAIIRYRYNMAPFSVEERKRPGPDRRSIEISKVSKEAFEAVIMKELFPRSAIDIFVEVLQADAGSRTACLNAASVALVDAGVPMKGMITSVAVGKADGQLVLDPMKEEDNFGEADMPFAFLIRNGKIESIALLQMDGRMTRDEVKQAIELAKKGALQIYEMQREAILRRYIEVGEEMDEITEGGEDA